MLADLPRNPLTVRFRASWLMRCWLLLLHVMAMIAVTRSALPLPLSLLFVSGLLFGAGWHWRAWVRPGTCSLTELSLWPEGDGELVTADRTLAVRWVPGGYRMPGIQLLCVREPGDSGRCHRVLILPDMASFEDRCRLRGFVSRFEADQRNIFG